jgi:CubicO group peptidase (beta-lactamase class C family)
MLISFPLYALTLCALFLSLQKASAQYDFTETGNQIEKYKSQLGGNVATIIWKDGKVIYQKENGNMEVDKVAAIASCSKWLSAALVMSFVDEGKLSVEDTIGKYLPVFTQYGKGQIKIKNCLSHTTGLESEPLNLFSIMKENSYSSLEAQVNDIAKNRKIIAEPGAAFRYSSMGLSIAARILEVITHKDFETLFQERIAVPLGMKNTSFGKRLASPSGGARSTANDYMQFLIMILNKGEYNGKRILSEKSVTQMQQAQTTLQSIKYAPKGAEGFNYAFGEWIEEADKNDRSIVLTSPGLFGTWPYVDNCRHYACIFFVRKFISETTKQIYLHLKETIDKQIPSKCQ